MSRESLTLNSQKSINTCDLFFYDTTEDTKQALHKLEMHCTRHEVVNEMKKLIKTNFKNIQAAKENILGCMEANWKQLGHNNTATTLHVPERGFAGQPCWRAGTKQFHSSDTRYHAKRFSLFLTSNMLAM